MSVLLALAVLITILAVIALVLIILANLGSPTGEIVVSFWPVLWLALIAVALLVLHHFVGHVGLRL